MCQAERVEQYSQPEESEMNTIAKLVEVETLAVELKSTAKIKAQATPLNVVPKQKSGKGYKASSKKVYVLHGNASVVCVDLAKDKFQVHQFDRGGACVDARAMTRKQFMGLFVEPPKHACVAVMEACGGSHYWGRYLIERGFEAKLVPAQFVAKLRVGNKNDGNDADAIFAAHKNLRVKPVPVKSVEQQDQSGWHSVRKRLMTEKVACINQARGLMAERGVVVDKGDAGFRELMQALHQEPNAETSLSMLQILEMIRLQLQNIERDIDEVEVKLKAFLKASPVAKQIDSVLGIGLITATAVAADTGGCVDRFASGREFAASIGATPKEHSSGEKQHMGGITKRGKSYLRCLLTQGAQSIVNAAFRRDDAICLVARRMFEKGKHRNTVVSAVVNRMARIIWAVIKYGENYRPQGGRPKTPTLAYASA
jgi:transposase